MSLFGFACPSHTYLWSSVSNTIFCHLRSLYICFNSSQIHLKTKNLHSIFSYNIYNPNFCFLNHLNFFAIGRFFEQIVWGLWHYLFILCCVYKALYLLWSTLIHPFICSLIQPLSLLKYLLSTCWNQVLMLDLWCIVINTNSERSGTLNDSVSSLPWSYQTVWCHVTFWLSWSSNFGGNWNASACL